MFSDPPGYRFSLIRLARVVMLAVAIVVPCGAQAQTVMPEHLPSQIVHAFDALFDGPHAGRRAVHAKGVLCEGVFMPSPSARSVSRAEHFANGDVPVLVRFSNFAAVPSLPDGDPAASPRGIAVKFVLPEGESTDIVAHSYNGFPASTPEDFLAFLRAVPNQPALEQFAASHPAARAFLNDPKPAPASYGTETYFGVNAFRFINAAGVSAAGRYRFVPLAGVAHLDAAGAAARAPDYLAEALKQQLQSGPVAFRLEVQLAGEGDDVNDGAVTWPADRPTVELGSIRVVALAPVDDARHTDLTFVPTNIVGGIGLTDDPMLLARTQAYQVSARRRSGGQ